MGMKGSTNKEGNRVYEGNRESEGYDERPQNVIALMLGCEHACPLLQCLDAYLDVRVQ